MSKVTIINGTPHAYSAGTRDVSDYGQVYNSIPVPKYCTHAAIFAQWGPLFEEIPAVFCDKANRTALFGVDTFDPTYPWYTHTTELSNITIGAGASHFITRLREPGMGPKASVRLWMDVLPTKIPQYQRNFDGSYMLDVDGDPIPTGVSVDGYSIGWYTTTIPVTNGIPEFGGGQISAGTQVDALTGVRSQRYPIMDAIVAWYGSRGNDYGIRLFAPTTKTYTRINTELMEGAQTFPFKLGIVRRVDNATTPVAVATLQGEQLVDFGLKPKALWRDRNKSMDFNAVVLPAYNRSAVGAVPAAYGPFTKAMLYQDNIDQLLASLYAAEKAASPDWYDFDPSKSDESQRYLINPFTAVTAYGAPYKSVTIASGGTGNVSLVEGATLWAQGASDGVRNLTTLAQAAGEVYNAFADPSTALCSSDARFPITHLSDSGYPLDIKLKMIDALGASTYRYVTVMTHEVGKSELTASEEHSLAAVLYARFQMYPESETFATKTCRGSLITRSGKRIDSAYPYQLPVGLEILEGWAEYMGASSGNWVAGKLRDRHPGSTIKTFTDVNVEYKPFEARLADWKLGVTWIEAFDLSSFFVPVTRTIHENDRSVLANPWVVSALCAMDLVLRRVHREMSGSVRLSPTLLLRTVEEKFTEKTQGAFDNVVGMSVHAFMDADDVKRGYSWSVEVKVAGEVPSSVESFYFSSYRMDQLIQEVGASNIYS